MPKIRSLLLATFAGALLAPVAVGKTAETTPVPLPGAPPGIGFDDLRYSKALGRVLAPAARSGKLDLVDPVSLQVAPIGGFSAQPRYDGGHDFGVTSVDEGADLLFAVDRTSKKLAIVDPRVKAIVSQAPLAADPDYVRFVGPDQLWVTEPDAEQIEVFQLARSAPPAAKHLAVIAVKGGPESLVVDAARKRAYAHLWKGKTVAIDLAGRAVVETWDNGCKGSRGIALDGARGLVFVGCAEGAASVLDVAHGGRRLARLESGSGVDVIDFSPSLRHLYLPGARSATMAILGVSDGGQLSLLGTVPTAAHAHCVTTDDAGRAFVCDPEKGRLLLYRDGFQKTR